MKITLEKVNAGKARLSIVLNGELYIETWREEENGNISCSLPIIEQLNQNGIEYEEELEEFLDSVDVAQFINLCSIY